MKRIVVTGGTGFVGRNVLPLLADSEVHVFDKNQGDLKSVVWHAVDLSDVEKTRNLLREIQPTHLLHLAWFVPPNEFWTSTENVAWVYRSFELLKSFAETGGKRAVLIGSCAEYDWTIGDFCDENKTPLKPSTLYGAAKRSLFELATIYAANVGLSLAWARLFFMFGEGEPDAKFVAYLIKSLLKGEKAVCKNPDLARDYLYIKEVAGALKMLLETDTSGAINVASGKPTRIGDLTETIGEITGKQNLIEFTEKADTNEPAFVVASTKRLVEEVGWKPKYTLENALREYAEQIKITE
jgi:nucleoside-diphosphate-sugar epimerase